MSKMFQIYEHDLAELERTLPQLMDSAFAHFVKGNPSGNRLRVQFRRVKEILSNIRWNYCPPVEIEIIPADDSPDPLLPA